MKFVQIVTLWILISNSWAVDRRWWKHATMYEVFLKSFKDSNGDGVGDIRGIISKLDYLVDIGIDTIWVTPYFPSSMADGGYDITDFYGIDPTYGTTEDFDELLKEMKKRDLNFVMDLVINHSSDEHEWFQKSIKKVAPYTDYYVWADPKGYDQNGIPIPPCNWVSIFDTTRPTSGWTWNAERKQFYFHQFGVKQPDFNLRNEDLKNDLKAVMKFWLDKGVAAFRVDAVPFFMEDPLFPDEGDTQEWLKVALGLQEGFSARLNHPDTVPFLNELALYLRQYDRKNKKPLESAIIAEAYGHVNILKRYFGPSHSPINFRLTMLRKYLDAKQLIDHLNLWLKTIPKGAASNWALGNHDQGRIFQRFNKEYNNILLTLVTMLPGTSVIYYGEEISQEIFDFAPEKEKDRFVHRDHFRLPMQWDDSLNAGFTSAEKPWVPLHPGYWKLNVEAQKQQKDSTLNFFKELTSLRKIETFKYGGLKFYTISKWILAFTRTYRQSKYLVVLNLGMDSNIVDLHSGIDDLPATLTVAAASPNSGYKKGQKFSTISNQQNAQLMRPESSVVLTFE
ncbi:maltase A2-like [Planococcus citri]|uniref:maltase A2-like n=1 Tax=Planococcus citri TaxID=170843 RepID=UPI0031F915A6